MAEYPLYGSTTFYLSVTSRWIFGLLLFLVTMDNAAMNIHVQVFVWMYVFSILLGIYLGVEWLGHMVTLFNFLKNCQVVLQSG